MESMTAAFSTFEYRISSTDKQLIGDNPDKSCSRDQRVRPEYIDSDVVSGYTRNPLGNRNEWKYGAPVNYVLSCRYGGTPSLAATKRHRKTIEPILFSSQNKPSSRLADRPARRPSSQIGR